MFKRVKYGLAFLLAGLAWVAIMSLADLSAVIQASGYHGRYDR